MAARITVCSLVVIALGLTTVTADKPCAARPIKGKSVVCVCNTTYCDQITRQEPASGKYVAYTSSEAGSRFKNSGGEFHSLMWNEGASHTLEIDLLKIHQTTLGFGVTVTAAAVSLFYKYAARVQGTLLESYFGAVGIGYTFLRIPVAGIDYSTNDGTLSLEDLKYKIPMIQQIKNVATADVYIVASGPSWSPPKWMKTNEQANGPGFIKDEYMQTFADYFAKFLREYKKHGIDVWAITTPNEPQNALLPFTRFQDLGWTPGKMGRWIINNLGPTIKNSSDLKHVKILTVYDQRPTIPVWFNVMVKEYPEVLDWIDGIAVHWHLDKFTPAFILEETVKNYPDKFFISTAACEGAMPWQKEKVSLGDWSRADSYIHNILEALNYNLVGWIDWSLILDKTGDSPIIAFPENNEFVKQPMFYAMGHFSKWIPRGSVRVTVEEHKGFLEKSVENVAFLTPRGTIVIVLHNTGNARNVRIQLGGEHTVVALEKTSVTTVEFPAPSTSA